MLGSYQDDFSIHKSQVEALDSELKSWKSGIASQLGPQPMPLSKYKDWKAADHKTSSIFYSLVLFDGIIPNLYLNGLRFFADLVDICTPGEVHWMILNASRRPLSSSMSTTRGISSSIGKTASISASPSFIFSFTSLNV